MKNSKSNDQAYLKDTVYAELIEASNDGFCDWNIQTGEVYFSRRWKEILGYCEEDVEPHVRSWEKIVHPDDMPHVMEVLQTHLHGKTDHYETQHRVKCKNGEWKWIIDRGKVISRSTEGTPLRAAGSHIDITDRVLREQERLKFIEQERKTKNDLLNLNVKLQEAVKVRDEFLSIASHELKTPLTSLILVVQSLKKYLEIPSDLFLTQKIIKSVNQTEKQLLRLSNLVDNMLDVTRINSGKLILNFESFDLSELIQEIAERLEPQIEQATAKPLAILSLEKTTGKWDRYRLEQVITNLITNAIKYGGGKEISISLKNNKNFATIIVKDQGAGIPIDFQDKIFHRFERAKNLNQSSGLGLGLYISKQIIDAHNGKIWANSVPDQGCEFHVELPKND